MEVLHQVHNSFLDINEILNDYSTDIQEVITLEAQNIAKKGKNELKEKSPKRTGDYSKGWTVRTTKGRGSIECIIYNSKKPQLTHLLEKPHAKRNGGLTSPIVHIEPIEKKTIKEFEQAVEKIIKNGG